jgi:hypothetical protein
MLKTAKLPSEELPGSPSDNEGEASVPASTNLPVDLYAKIKAEAEDNERTIAAQLRLMAKAYYGPKQSA